MANQKVSSITNGGAGEPKGLSAAVTYQGRLGGLAATLSTSTAPALLTVSAAVGGLPDGTYNATVTVSGSGGTSLSIPVILSLSPLPPSLAIDPDRVSLAAAESATAPAQADVAVTNTGTGTLSGLTRSIIRYGAGQPTGWLSANLSNTTAPSTLTVFVRRCRAQPGYLIFISRACAAADLCSAYSNVASATTQADGVPPSAPQSLGATVLSSQHVDLACTDASTNETSFRLERRPNGSEWSQIAVIPANVTEYRDSGLFVGTAYRYCLKACNSWG